MKTPGWKPQWRYSDAWYYVYYCGKSCVVFRLLRSYYFPFNTLRETLSADQFEN